MANTTDSKGPSEPETAADKGGERRRAKGRKWSHITVHASPAFHHEYKLYALENGLTMQQLLMESFELFKKTRAGQGKRRAG
jgi:hypothetical protein